MMRKGKRKSATVCLAAAFILACYLVRTIDCSRLSKTGRRGGRNEPKTIGFQEGKIVFGRVFEKVPRLQDANRTRKASSNASVEDETAYQADSAGWSKGQANDPSSKEASWKRMAPSLQCGSDQMKFKAIGPGASQFAVDQGNTQALPLSLVSPTCGYTMQRNSLALVMLVPFDGCNVVQEGGSYVLPMRWQGLPVSLLCPAPAPTPAEPTTGTQSPSTTTTAAKAPGMHQHYPPFFPFYFFPPLPSVTTAAPTTTATPAATAPPPPHSLPLPFYPPPYPPFLWPLPGPLPTAASPQLPQFPMLFPYQFPPHFFPPIVPLQPTSKPTTTTPATTTTTTEKPAPVLMPLLHDHLHSHPHGHGPFPFPFMPYPPPSG